MINRSRSMGIIFLVLFSGYCIRATSYITYELTYGRFGDHLVSYMHTKWLAYKYGLRLLYRPFIHSDELVLDDCEERLPIGDFRNCSLWVRSEDVLQKGMIDNVLYMVAYFPESRIELKTWPSGGFQVNWDDEQFRSLLNTVVAPKAKITPFPLPKNKITVALHTRRGGSYDIGSYEEFHKSYPAKFPNEEFYVEALDRLYTILGEQDLYVFIFTDDQNPAQLTEQFEKTFKGKHITFDYRKTKNDHNINVLEDFFALTQFDCLIRSDSNFSLCASKLKKYLVHIAPQECSVVNGRTVVSSLAVDVSW